MDTTQKFSGLAKDYTAGRPSYAPKLIDHLYNRYNLSPASVIADIGSGTGKFARHLLEKGSEVYCVEPNEDMRRMAEAELCDLANFHSVAGTAEKTLLADGFVDCITSAQAFHWFNVEAFKQECSRILKTGGRVFLIWNVRDAADAINRDLHQIFSHYCPNFHGFSGGILQDDPRIKAFFADKYEYAAFDNPLHFDKENFISRSLSGSYSLKEGDRDYAAYIEALTAVFNKYAQNGSVTVGNHSVAYIGTI